MSVTTESEEIFCFFCKENVVIAEFRAHETSDNHQNIIKTKLLEISTGAMMCKACFVPINSEVIWKSHSSGMKHIKQVTFHQKSGRKNAYNRPYTLGVIEKDSKDLIADSMFTEIPDLFAPLIVEPLPYKEQTSEVKKDKNWYLSKLDELKATVKAAKAVVDKNDEHHSIENNTASLTANEPDSTKNKTGEEAVNSEKETNRKSNNITCTEASKTNDVIRKYKEMSKDNFSKRDARDTRWDRKGDTNHRRDGGRGGGSRRSSDGRQDSARSNNDYRRDSEREYSRFDKRSSRGLRHGGRDTKRSKSPTTHKSSQNLKRPFQNLPPDLPTPPMMGLPPRFPMAMPFNMDNVPEDVELFTGAIPGVTKLMQGFNENPRPPLPPTSMPIMPPGPFPANMPQPPRFTGQSYATMPPAPLPLPPPGMIPPPIGQLFNMQPPVSQPFQPNFNTNLVDSTPKLSTSVNNNEGWGNHVVRQTNLSRFAENFGPSENASYSSQPKLEAPLTADVYQNPFSKPVSPAETQIVPSHHVVPRGSSTPAPIPVEGAPLMPPEDGIPPIGEAEIKHDQQFVLIGTNCIKVKGPDHFICELCDIPFNDKCKAEHLTDTFHLLNVLWNWDPASAQLIKDIEGVNKPLFRKKVYEAAGEVQKKEIKLLSEAQLRIRARILDEDVQNQNKYFVKYEMFDPADFGDYDFSYIVKEVKLSAEEKEESVKMKILEAGIIGMIKVTKPTDIVCDADTAEASLNVCHRNATQLMKYFNGFRGKPTHEILENLKQVKHYFNNLMIIQQILDVYPTAVKEKTADKEAPEPISVTETTEVSQPHVPVLQPPPPSEQPYYAAPQYPYEHYPTATSQYQPATQFKPQDQWSAIASTSGQSSRDPRTSRQDGYSMYSDSVDQGGIAWFREKRISNN